VPSHRRTNRAESEERDFHLGIVEEGGLHEN